MKRGEEKMTSTLLAGLSQGTLDIKSDMLYSQIALTFQQTRQSRVADGLSEWENKKLDNS